MKRIFKHTVIPLLASRPVSAIAGRLIGSGIPIFMLHRINADNATGNCHTPSYLRRCLRYLRNRHHTFVSIEDILAALRGEIQLPKKSVAFTMDDGFYDQATLAAPVFIEFRCPVTVFLITGMLDGKLWPWDDQVAYLVKEARTESIQVEFAGHRLEHRLDNPHARMAAVQSIQEFLKTIDGESVPELVDRLAGTARVNIPASPPDEYRPMTWDMARDLENQGISFAPHTISHAILSRLGNKNSAIEITGSWQRLKEELASPARVFGYPTGRTSDFGRREMEIVRQTGLLGAVSTIPASVDPGEKQSGYPYRLPRYGLPESFLDFVQYSTWIEQAKTAGTRQGTGPQDGGC
jgi:peptidoglycan/xylan/chitin deacetylase (PgdA/CDA1 family)